MIRIINGRPQYERYARVCRCEFNFYELHPNSEAIGYPNYNKIFTYDSFEDTAATVAEFFQQIIKALYEGAADTDTIRRICFLNMKNDKEKTIQRLSRMMLKGMPCRVILPDPYDYKLILFNM